MEFQLRDKIDGQYVVIEKHYGGMAVVYVCLDEFSQRRFAVKTLKEELLSDRTATSRFADEARTWMNLGRHPNIVEAIIYREIEGQPFLFLEYVDGSDLQALVDQEGALFPPQALAFFQQGCAGMAYVHGVPLGPGGRGVVHRDLKPANMMLTRQATVKITDFGLAKAFGRPTSELDVGVGVGTYLYMPPEQLLDASSADRTSDVYSFGVAMYVVLTGRPPFQARNANHMIRAIISQQPVSPSQLIPGFPRPLEEIVMRCVAKQREDRYQSFEELQAALAEVQQAVDAAYAEGPQALQCAGCGYRTRHRYASCPICANALGSPGSATRAPASSDTAPAAAPALDPTTEEAVVAELMASAESWRAQGDYQRASNLLRQALTIVPGHVEARRLLDETILQLARHRPKGPQKAYNWPVSRGNVARTGFTPEVLPPPLSRRWQMPVGDWILASPVVSNGLVFVGGRMDRPALQGHFVAVHAASGQVIWEYDTSHEILQSACVLGGQTVILAALNRLHAFDARTGHQIWDIATHSTITSDPMAWQNAIYFGTEDGSVLAVSADRGQLLWRFGAEMAVYSSPLVWEERVYVGSNDHKLYALDQRRGKLVWEFVAASDITTTPAFHQGRLYVSARDNRLYCLDAASGRRVWEFATDGPCTSSPAIWQDSVLIGSRDRRVYALDASTGACRWHYEAGDWVESSPAVSGRAVYFGCHNGHLYALEVETGVLLWEYEIGAEIASSPAISGGRLFVGANDGALYCFSARP
ncbi:MAG: PQQ-binding-like beta-propeller repeat protein [Armatimonadetes bacterium]|nr:PQQ-binding-like beta-propeller repeat protein [Armatimonadota bacterium]